MDKRIAMLAGTLVVVGGQGIQAKEGAYKLGDFGVSGPALLTDTEVFLNGRLRFEGADQDGKSGAAVASLRNRFGLKSGKLAGFSGLAEGEHTWILSNTSDYSPFPSAGRSVIADPDNFDLNRLQLDYTLLEDTDFVLGRQYINHGDQRFVGAVGWRQNDQTFDAASVTNKSIEGLTLTYVYANQVNRIFGTNAPAAALSRWHGDVHLLRGDYSACSIGTLSGFAYLMDFDNAVAASTHTYGVELKGSHQLFSALPEINYLFTTALQNGAGDNDSYEEYYFRADLGMKAKPLKGGLGFEWMTGDGTHSFVFPLGTNHKFGGFADAFLTTPDSGLVDYYAWLGGKCPLEVNHKFIFHHFSTDQGNNVIGYEFDYVGKKVLTQNTSVLVKLAHLEGSRAVRDVQRGSIQFDYSF